MSVRDDPWIDPRVAQHIAVLEDRLAALERQFDRLAEATYPLVAKDRLEKEPSDASNN